MAAIVIREMNRLGMMINVSHSSDETISQVIDVSEGPVIATHHGLRSVNNIPRNMPDVLLKKLAAKGGIIGFQIGSEFAYPKEYEWLTAQRGKTFFDTSSIPDRGQEAKRSMKWTSWSRPSSRCRGATRAGLRHDGGR